MVPFRCGVAGLRSPARPTCAYLPVGCFSSLPRVPGVTIRDTDIQDSTYDGIQSKAAGGAVPDVRISKVTISGSANGSGILAMGGARGSATLTDVTISGSRDGDVLVEPGSQFVIDTGAVRTADKARGRDGSGPPLRRAARIRAASAASRAGAKSQ